MNLKHCKLITLPKKVDERGLLNIIEGNQDIPFDIKRIFYLYDVPANQSRGAHAHKMLEQFIICLNGTLEVIVDDGHHKQLFKLTNPWEGIYIPPMIWTSVENFCHNAICLVLASAKYDESDYYRVYSEFTQAAQMRF